MAGSRLEKFGTVFTRVRDLMRSGVIKDAEKPVWYDVYKAFPPKKEPQWVKPMTKVYGSKAKDTVRDVFYREDEIRVKFYEAYGSGPRAFELSNAKFVSSCQRFVDKYVELERRGELEESSLFEETGKALLAEGLVLRRRGGPAVAPETKDSVLGMNLAEMLSEQQIDAADEAQVADEEASTQTTQQ